MNKKSTFFYRFLFFLGLIFIFYPNILFAADVTIENEKIIIPSDPYFINQWYLQKIKATEAWSQIKKSSKVVIAIIDSGVQIDHPDLKNNIWINRKELPDNNIDDDNNGYIDDINGWDFINGVSDPSPKFKPGFTDSGIFHGTVIAGIAAASGNNAMGVTGISWQAKIMPLKALDDAGGGSINNVIKAIDYAIDNGADIINLSFVGLGYNKNLDNIIKKAYDAGLIIVAAVGNEQEQGYGNSLDIVPLYPVCNDGQDNENRVIGVAAVDALDQKTFFSNYGFKCVDISAPGVNVFSTLVYSPTNYFNEQSFNNYYGGYWSGTSVATPMVSGALALIAAANPSLTREQILKIFYDSSENLNKLNPNYLNQLGKGRLNIAMAVNQASALLKNNSSKIITAPLENYLSLLKITDQNGIEKNNFYAYGNKFMGGLSIASGDINGDGLDEIITGAGQGGGPHVKIFNKQGELIGQFFAYAENFYGGINITVADIDLDGLDEIIVTPASKHAPEIKIFNFRGKLKKSFMAYNLQFKNGVYVAVGDVNGDGRNEIITGAGQGGGPQVRIFNTDGRVLSQFFAYNTSFRGGVKVAVGNIETNLKSKGREIITAPGNGGGPHIRIFNNYGNLLKQFFAFNNNFRGGVNITTGDINNDGIDEIIAGAGPGGAPHVKVFDVDDKIKIIGSFYALEETFTNGINVAVIKKY
ncbi:MAG: S8 family serine peptidase [Patescibacteria group bacterium]|nr:S8 family serine peptidase [Patescibacteria group bacterium]MBU1871013.1 S8 family serine peptidase [Patescibacteria group bacterium]